MKTIFPPGFFTYNVDYNIFKVDNWADIFYD